MAVIAQFQRTRPIGLTLANGVPADYQGVFLLRNGDSEFKAMYSPPAPR